MSEVTVPEFKPWPKIPRLRRSIVITEKIDGTNAIIHVAEDGTLTLDNLGTKGPSGKW